MELMDRIRLLRKAKGWTQTELGKKIGVIQKLIADYETGNTKPPIDRLPLLADALGVTVDELLRGEAMPAPEPNKAQQTHGNSRVAKIQDVFEKLPPAKQKQVLSHAKALLGKQATP
jgi:transcriptional regulator with XRE-family HTH domain